MIYLSGKEMVMLKIHQKVDLVATYEEAILKLPATECMTEYFGDYGGFFMKRSYEGFDEGIFNQRFQEALNALGLTEDEFENEYVTGRRFCYRGNIKQAFETVLSDKSVDDLISAAKSRVHEVRSSHMEKELI